MDIQIGYWQKLKDEIYNVRKYGYESTNIVGMSEVYFKMADDTVAAAERYSKSTATVIIYLEIFTAIDITILIIILLLNPFEAIVIRCKNR